MHISYININYKRFAGDCFEMNSSAVQLNLRFLRHSAWGERIYLRFIPGKRHFASIVSPVLLSAKQFSLWIYGSNHIGGIDCANGYIYAPVEGKVDGKHLYNFILLYDCKMLKYTGIYIL